MQDFSQLLAARSADIVSQWTQAVARSQKIQSSDGLSCSAIRNHIDQVIEALFTVLSQKEDNDIHQIIEASLSHGNLRAAQGFDPGEIAHEYHLLRLTIRQTFQAELMQGTATEAVRAIAIIDEVIDAAISHCFRSYHTKRVAELVQIQEQLNLTIKELTRLVRLSQDRLSALAHEFKSPLSAIIGYAEIFLRQQQEQCQDVATSEYEAIERIIRAGQHLLCLINDTLELAQSNRDLSPANPVQISPTEMLTDVVGIMQPLALDRQLTLVLQLQDVPAAVVTDPVKFQQVLVNLISNAIRYTSSGTVTVTGWIISAERWAVSVSDTGDGIPPSDQTRIFEPFVRIHPDDEARPTKSLGLGLAIVERLLGLLQGQIFLTSEAGTGTTFTILLPTVLSSSGRGFHAIAAEAQPPFGR